MNILSSKRESAKSISYRWNTILNTIIASYTAICLLPFLLVFIVSFTDEKSISRHGYSFFPKVLSLEAYKSVILNTKSIGRIYLISIIVTVIGTLLGLLIMAMYAYPISRSSFRYRTHFTFYIYFTMLFGGGMVPWYIICTQVLKMKNTIWALIVPYLFNVFYVIILRTFFKTIHESIIESAKLDGASEIKIFRSIILPLSLPVLASVGLFTSIGYWNDWWLSLMFQDSGYWINLQYAMYKVLENATYLATLSGGAGGGLTQSQLANMPTETMRMAMCVFAIGPIILAYPFFQRYFVSGLTIGSIKG